MLGWLSGLGSRFKSDVDFPVILKSRRLGWSHNTSCKRYAQDIFFISTPSWMMINRQRKGIPQSEHTVSNPVKIKFQPCLTQHI